MGGGLSQERNQAPDVLPMKEGVCSAWREVQQLREREEDRVRGGAGRQHADRRNRTPAEFAGA